MECGGNCANAIEQTVKQRARNSILICYNKVNNSSMPASNDAFPVVPFTHSFLALGMAVRCISLLDCFVSAGNTELDAIIGCVDRIANVTPH